MMARSQITLDAEQHKRARERAAALGISLAEYFRRLVAKDIAQPRRTGSPAGVFDLGDSGGSDVALQKDEYIGTALAARRSTGRRARRKSA